MSQSSSIIEIIAALSLQDVRLNEESTRAIFTGSYLSEEVATILADLLDAAAKLSIVPALVIDGESASADSLRFASQIDILQKPWTLSLGKSKIAEGLICRPEEKVYFFCSAKGFESWLKDIDPFVQQDERDPDFLSPVTFRIYGLTAAYGNATVYVLPMEAACPIGGEDELPSRESIGDVIHVNANKLVRVCPRSWALTWGEVSGEVSALWRAKAYRVLASCLVQELRCSSTSYEVTIRGTKRVTLPLGEVEHANGDQIKQLTEAVKWVYEERAETRLRLIMDRLSIDLDPSKSYVEGLRDWLQFAFQQAKDSYAFVILERKDAYHKEMRDLMKDMKTQSDLYASKVRDLVASITRDVLGIFIFLAISFVGKFDQSKLHSLLASAELGLILKFLSCYLALSCFLQLSAHIRDADLAFKESSKWLSVLQNYTSKAEAQTQFLGLLNERRGTFQSATILCAAIYGALAGTVWNLPTLIKHLLT